MRVFVFLDTPRQSSYVDTVRVALANVPAAQVIAGGYGVSPHYFGIADDGGRGVAEPEALDTKGRWLGYLKRGLSLGRGLWRQVRSAGRQMASILIAAPLRWLGRTGPGKLARTVLRRQKAHTQDGTRRTAAKLRPVIAPLAEIPRVDQIIFQMLRRRLYLHQAKQMLLQARPDLVVTMEDNVEGLTGVTTTAARRLAIPVVILPDYIPNPLEPAQYYHNSKDHLVRRLQDIVVARRSKKWVFHYRSRDMLRLPSSTIIAYRLLRCDSPAPWVLNSGYSSAIALESTAMLAHYLRLGFDRDKLQVIGTAQDDGLHDRFQRRDHLRAKLLGELKLDANRPLVLCALPPDQYAGSDASRFEYASYPRLIEAWFAELGKAAQSANVIVRPHPRTSVDMLKPFCPTGVHILTAATDSLVPLCDLYVASISTTIRWALGLGIPVLNYDCYRYAYGDFASAKGCVEVTDRRAFADTLDGFLNDAAFSDRITESANGDAAVWGKLDGQFHNRLKTLLEQVLLTPSVDQPTHTAAPSLLDFQ